MFFFKRRKKEKTLEAKLNEFHGNELTAQEKKNPHKVEHYVIERLEQMIEANKEIEEEKAEYKVVTAYLNDIQIIEDLPDGEKKKISEIAQNVVQLNEARNEFLHAEKKITDVQYAQMQQEEREIPNAIKRLKNNESYQAMIKKDMKYLEREKEEWLFYREDLTDEKNRMQNLIYIVVGLAATAAVAMLIVQLLFEVPMQLGWTIWAFLVVLAISMIYLKVMNAQKEFKKAKVNADRAITLLNQVKIKYVNITNAIDYACEKYHVNNSNELNRVWECYMEAVKQKEKFEQNSDDLDYYCERLVKALKQFHLYDAKVWVPQAVALVNHNEMVEITHGLVTRRQKLRSRMEYNADIVRRQRQDVDKLMNDVKEMKPQIKEILDSIDKLSGNL